uniref:Uncharacterized protein n=1 Tax=Anguilla anguilla TaxID=7936 RepID=A0A0E9X827_ANGAN
MRVGGGTCLNNKKKYLHTVSVSRRVSEIFKCNQRKDLYLYTHTSQMPVYFSTRTCTAISCR